MTWRTREAAVVKLTACNGNDYKNNITITTTNTHAFIMKYQS
ncbi:hypothetical protein DOY81_013378 [Sarcophaga bullata]|nr:hypothetical protein DOY81_013378 [Sarcophaga bullata]